MWRSSARCPRSASYVSSRQCLPSIPLVSHIRRGRGADALNFTCAFEAGDADEITVDAGRDEDCRRRGDAIEHVTFAAGVAPADIDRVMIMADIQLHLKFGVQPLTGADGGGLAG